MKMSAKEVRIAAFAIVLACILSVGSTIWLSNSAKTNRAYDTEASNVELLLGVGMHMLVQSTTPTANIDCTAASTWISSPNFDIRNPHDVVGLDIKTSCPTQGTFLIAISAPSHEILTELRKHFDLHQITSGLAVVEKWPTPNVLEYRFHLDPVSKTGSSLDSEEHS